MAENYTPSPVDFTNPPYSIPTHDDHMSETFFQDRYKLFHDNIYYTYNEHLILSGKHDALKTKLGITVTNPDDDDPPNYTSGYVLPSSGAGKSHHDALETVDNELKYKNQIISNMINNIGGMIHQSDPLQYTSTNYLAEGDSHHQALEKLDDNLGVTANSVSSNTSNITDHTTYIDNMASKMGTGAKDAAGFDYLSENFLVDEETIKHVLEKFDKIVYGTRRQNEKGFSWQIYLWSKQETALGHFYESFYDLTKKHTNTTATIDIHEQKAYGSTKAYYASWSASGSSSQALFDWQTNELGSIVVKFNCINSFSDGDMVTVSESNMNDKVWVAATTGSGSNIVLKIEISGDAEIYNLSMLGK